MSLVHFFSKCGKNITISMGCESEVLLYTNYILTALSGDSKKQRLNFCVCVYSFLFLYFTSY